MMGPARPERVALFVPCYVDQLRPGAAVAAQALLEEQGLEVAFPEAQTCCGQPLWNTGHAGAAREIAVRMVEVFAGYDAVVSPSASCVAMVRCHYPELLGGANGVGELALRTFELCEFLVGSLGVVRVDRSFPHRVGLHVGCHGLRELGLGAASERPGGAPGPVRQLLSSMSGLELVELERADDCCGFGGSFAVEEEAVSGLMGEDRLLDHRAAGAEVVASTDSSCLLHLEGLARRRGWPIHLMHVAEVLAGWEPVP